MHGLSDSRQEKKDYWHNWRPNQAGCQPYHHFLHFLGGDPEQAHLIPELYILWILFLGGFQESSVDARLQCAGHI